MKLGKWIVGVIGTGTMGSGIAQVIAAAGHQVLIFDNVGENASRALSAIASSLDKLAQKGKITTEEKTNIVNRITIAPSLEGLAESNLVIEAIIEDPEIKKKLFSDLEGVVDAGCILATNTSSLSVTSIASACSSPARVIGLHFFNPAPLLPLVEIVPGLATAESILESARIFIAECGKTGVVAKDSPGFIVNRIARPFYGESIRIFEEGWEGISADENGLATIDHALKIKGGFKMGPFELMDLIGNDINYTVTETVWKQFFYDARYKPSLTQKRLFEAGRFGRKSGRGYYNYSPDAVVAVPDTDDAMAGKIFLRVISMLINEAADALQYNLASREDIDLAMTKGVNYPKGLLKWCDEIGAEVILNQIKKLRSTYNEDRYRPSVLLQRIAAEGLTFYHD